MKRFPSLILVAAAVTATAGLSSCDGISSDSRTQKTAVNWDGPIEEIAHSSITRDGKLFIIMMESRIDAPPDKVWAAMKHPELLSKNSDQYKKSELLKDEGNHKELVFHVMLLDALQMFSVSMDFDDAAHALKVKTLLTTFADIDGTYTLSASPDGQRTLYRYDAKQVFKVSLPLAEEIYRREIEEGFVNQLRAIKKQIVGCDVDPAATGCQGAD